MNTRRTFITLTMGAALVLALMAFGQHPAPWRVTSRVTSTYRRTSPQTTSSSTTAPTTAPSP